METSVLKQKIIEILNSVPESKLRLIYLCISEFA